MQESNGHGDGPGQGAQGVRDDSATGATPFRVIGDCEAQEQTTEDVGGGETAAGEMEPADRSNLAAEREVERKDSVWDSGCLVVSSDYGGRVALVEAWVGIVDFAHKAYQSKSGYEALL